MIRDPVTGEHALLGTTRAGRPNEYRDGPEGRCAFCPGNEDLTPPEITRTGTAQRWDVRVFRNKYPAIVPPDGDHEVIVDSREHDDEITPSGMEMWRARYCAALERMPSGFPVLFKNSGANAGATIMHPHTQLIVLPSRPDRWQNMSSESGGCALCDERVRSEADGTVVERHNGVAAFVRAHSRFSWSLTILPDACVQSLDRTDAQAWGAAGTLVARAARAVRAFGPRAGVNVLVYSDPHAKTGTFHWHIEAVPRENTLAGFELSTGMFIRGATAQESADRWRRMIAPLDGSL